MKQTTIGYNSSDFYYKTASDIYEQNGTLKYNNSNITCASPSYPVNDNICATLKSTDKNAGEQMVNCYLQELCKNKDKASQLHNFLPENISVSTEKYNNSKNDYNIEYLIRMNYILGIVAATTISIYYIIKT